MLNKRIKASLTHLTVSALVAFTVFIFIRTVWFPDSYWNMSGGNHLFILLTGVDVIVGPLLTLIIFNHKKSRRELFVDISIVALFQMVALCYGLYSMYLARPVFTVFVVDRLNVVVHVDLEDKDLKLAELPRYSQRPLWGPELIAARRAKSSDETLEIVSDASSGKDVQLQPKFYQPYISKCPDIKQHLKSLDVLRSKNLGDLKQLNQNLKDIPIAEKNLGYLPTLARKEWVAIVNNQSCHIEKFLPYHGF